MGLLLWIEVARGTKSKCENVAIITGNDAFYAVRNESKHQYLIINYDKFSQPYSPDSVYYLMQQKLDFIVIDEIQFIKRRNDPNGEKESKRRKVLGGLLTHAKDNNPRNVCHSRLKSII